MTLLCGAPCQQRQALLRLPHPPPPSPETALMQNCIIAHFMISGERIKQHACLRIDENTRDNNKERKQR